ncbi:MAG: hypothetical protein IPF92_14470 [Myxococcales bacterium]|jgi:hypothetical protein|nr:hypothetical protein [Myxococcales bacterium]MBL0195082.1 hypothetical protein [Myxococcales bacterium]HQY65412.1 hypothetical protein [Polyangiaceae bacterium]
MEDPCESVTLSALANRLQVPRARLGGGQRLAEDWRLGPADLMLVALEVADALGRVLTFDGLAATRTVGDLVALVRVSPTDEEAFGGEPVEPMWPLDGALAPA